MKKIHTGESGCKNCSLFGNYLMQELHYYCEVDKVVSVEINPDTETSRKCPKFKSKN